MEEEATEVVCGTRSEVDHITSAEGWTYEWILQLVSKPARATYNVLIRGSEEVQAGLICSGEMGWRLRRQSHTFLTIYKFSRCSHDASQDIISVHVKGQLQG